MLSLRDILQNRLQCLFSFGQMTAAGLSEHGDGFLNAGQGVSGAALLHKNFRHEMERDAGLNL